MEKIERLVASMLVLLIMVGILNWPAVSSSIHSPQEKIKSKVISFSEPYLIPRDEYVMVKIDGANSYILSPNKPILPAYNIVMKFPSGTKILDVNCTFSQIKTLHFHRKILLAPTPEEINMEIDQEKRAECQKVFPSKWYNYRIGGGLDGDKRVTFLSIHIYPVRYLPGSSLVEYIRCASIKVKYAINEESLQEQPPHKYDLLIISPPEFSDNLQPLVNHKNSYNISTKLVTLDEINEKGRDKQEQIKYYIKKAIEKWGIKYVMLVGDERKMPVRYSYAVHNLSPLLKLSPFISDLYYADIYDGNGSFCSWDTNNNNKFGEIKIENGSYVLVDKVDLYPDVYVGRLLCSNSSEVDVIVKKIINYEKCSRNRSWYSNLIVCGGNTHKRNLLEFLNGGIAWEGECIGNRIIDIMKDFNPVRLYASAIFPLFNIYNAAKLTRENINKAINDGAGFVVFIGHGSPINWATHPPIFKRVWLPFPLGYLSTDIGDLNNKDKLPLVVLDGCSCGDFSNLTGVPSPIAWEFVKSKEGGAIASLAPSTIAYCLPGNLCTECFDGYMDIALFLSYSQGFHTPGSMLENAQISYINNVIKELNPLDYQTVEEWTLFGDPSLQLGGYS